MRRVVLILCVVLLPSAAHGIVLQISVNGDPDPADSEILLGPGQTITLDVHSPSGHSGGPEDDVYWFLEVERAYGTITGGVPMDPEWPVEPCPPGPLADQTAEDICENGIYGAIFTYFGQSIPPGVYIDDITYWADDIGCGLSGDAVVTLITTQDFASYTVQDTLVIHQQGQDCLKATAPEYADWVARGKPDCWCCRYQCRGDIDCIQTGPFPVGIPDLTLFRLAFNQVVLPPGGECADLDHVPIGPFRCGISDLQIFKKWFNQIEVPCCDLDGDCILTPADKYNCWTG
ncbi:MAG: hypothetical protein ACYST6_02310 [Planctomycetota bacterium]|jgi:hypothetical protein